MLSAKRNIALVFLRLSKWLILSIRNSGFSRFILRGQNCRGVDVFGYLWLSWFCGFASVLGYQHRDLGSGFSSADLWLEGKESGEGAFCFISLIEF